MEPLQDRDGEPEPRGRFQYSLASLFWLTTIVAVVMGCVRVFGVQILLVPVLIAVILLVLGYVFAPLLLFVVLCWWTRFPKGKILKVEAGVCASLLGLTGLASVLEMLMSCLSVSSPGDPLFFPGFFSGALLVTLLVWAPQWAFIGSGILAMRSGDADRNLRKMMLPKELEVGDPDSLEESLSPEDADSASEGTQLS